MADQIDNETESEDQFEDIVPVYANFVRFEVSAWDLRMFFGQLVPGGEADIDYHTDVAIPWAQAKLMHLYLGINIMIYERQNGQIPIPRSVMPAPLASPPEGADASSPDAIETFLQVQQKIKEFRDREQGSQKLYAAGPTGIDRALTTVHPKAQGRRSIWRMNHEKGAVLN